MITLDTNLPLEVYNEFFLGIKNAFPKVKNIALELNIKNVNKDLAEFYYRQFIDEIAGNSPLIKSFRDYKVSYTNSFNIIVSNKAEEMKLNSIKRELESKFKSVGFDTIIEIIVNHDEKLAYQI